MYFFKQYLLFQGLDLLVFTFEKMIGGWYLDAFKRILHSLPIVAQQSTKNLMF